ncbi:MAG: ATP synthase F1 subunit gamma [Candidatus Aminicenantes bacterium]
MPALIDLRRRIKSVRNTQQITRAMKTVATAKFKQAQRNVLSGRPYWHNIPFLLQQIITSADRSCHPLLAKRKEKRILVLVMTSDKGLCGAFNANLLGETRQFLKEKSEHADIRLILIGKKACQFFKRQNYPVIERVPDDIHKLGESDLNRIAGDVIRDYTHQKSDAVYFIYNEFKSILRPRITKAKILPVEPPEKQEAVKAERDWIPESELFFKTILPFYIKDQIKHFYHESIAAEQAARMMAMDNATKNAQDLIKDLTLVMNKIRQASITTELLEIMSAVDALKKDR